jgi:hypothetical protein
MFDSCVQGAREAYLEVRCRVAFQNCLITPVPLAFCGLESCEWLYSAGFAKEGGKLRASGSGFELLQQYTSYKNGPGAAVTEEVEDPNNRTFDILFLDESTLVIRLKSTRFRDSETGRQTTVTPDSDYFLVWTKVGSSSVPQLETLASRSQEEESAGGGGLFGGFGTAMIRRQPSGAAGRATVAERSVGAASDKQDARAATAARRREEAEERKRAQQEAAEQRRAEAEEKKLAQRQEAEQRRAEAEERKRAQQVGNFKAALA